MEIENYWQASLRTSVYVCFATTNEMNDKSRGFDHYTIQTRSCTCHCVYYCDKDWKIVLTNCIVSTEKFHPKVILKSRRRRILVRLKLDQPDRFRCPWLSIMVEFLHGYMYNGSGSDVLSKIPSFIFEGHPWNYINAGTCICIHTYNTFCFCPKSNSKTVTFVGRCFSEFFPVLGHLLHDLLDAFCLIVPSSNQLIANLSGRKWTNVFLPSP